MKTDIIKLYNGTENPETVEEIIRLIGDWCYSTGWMRTYNQIRKTEQTIKNEKQWKKK